MLGLLGGFLGHCPKNIKPCLIIQNANIWLIFPVDDFNMKETSLELFKLVSIFFGDLSSKLRSQLQNSKSRTSTQAKFGGNKKPTSTVKAAEGVWNI